MATGASTADAAVLLIDARKGVLTQTKRHSRIAAMFGVRHIALAVNKMDLVDWSRSRFEEIDAAYRQFAQDLEFTSITAIPLSALEGQNILEPAPAIMPWYHGQSLLHWLETVPSAERQIYASIYHARAMGQSPQPGFPRLLRTHRHRLD